MKQYEIEIQVFDLTPTENAAVNEALKDIVEDGGSEFLDGFLIIHGCINVPALMTERQIFEGAVRDIGAVVSGKRIIVSGQRVAREPEFVFSTEATCPSP